MHNGSEDRSAKAKHTTPKNPTVSHRIASHCEPKRTGLQRSIAQFMQIQSQSLAALLVAFYDGLHELQVLEREREQREREREMAIDGSTLSEYNLCEGPHGIVVRE